ncbi:ABC transporter, ATP binding component, possibly iron transporter [Prochlorococcus marinus str. MIT 9215]|uniref:ABC-type quaternary amine transporter n=1 Tax=Prochlorococcus marinus (strain MIT 9215) TaxID=93060 RepID=A8G4I2_PROM2|nr:ABC transporter ATP-binding protein [Prochlorococcus marinus]ABV50513.1 ABC transporter, ATP binding component, possibly iron transporter [Prochlorococcus marinus str. MIT 9215]
MKNDALIIDGLHHKYHKREKSNWILKEINIKIESGELLGLLGPSGCGKTTLLRLIAGFEYPSKGRISLNDNEISNSNRILSPEKRNICMVFQDYALFPHLTVIQNVMFGLKNKKDRSRVDYLLNVVGLERFVGRYPHELSGGQKQRLAIARALAPGTKFILLDEPFCSLDMHVKLKLRSELPNILRECNASGLMVTHDPEEAMAICDKVAVMNEGEIHQIDTPINLLNNPKSIFVSSFILGNNILNLQKNGNSYMSSLGEINSSNLSNNSNMKSMSISPKFISIKRSKTGNAIVISKEFLGEFLIYKVSINEDILRVRTNINNQLNNGDKCSISINKNSYYFLYPGAQKVYF